MKNMWNFTDIWNFSIPPAGCDVFVARQVLQYSMYFPLEENKIWFVFCGWLVCLIVFLGEEWVSEFFYHCTVFHSKYELSGNCMPQKKKQCCSCIRAVSVFLFDWLFMSQCLEIKIFLRLSLISVIHLQFALENGIQSLYSLDAFILRQVKQLQAISRKQIVSIYKYL